MRDIPYGVTLIKPLFFNTLRTVIAISKELCAVPASARIRLKIRADGRFIASKII
jgi:hypothetical protein